MSKISLSGASIDRLHAIHNQTSGGKHSLNWYWCWRQ